MNLMSFSGKRSKRERVKIESKTNTIVYPSDERSGQKVLTSTIQLVSNWLNLTNSVA